MDRDQFEAWLEEHGSEAIERIDDTRMPLSKWLTLYGKALKYVAEEYGPAEDDDTEPDPEAGPLDFNYDEV
jgi:hypothetical protein